MIYFGYAVIITKQFQPNWKNFFGRYFVRNNFLCDSTYNQSYLSYKSNEHDAVSYSNTYAV